MSGVIPIACNLDTLSTLERQRRSLLAARIRDDVMETRETDVGYRLHLKSDPALYKDALERIFLERRCCPFLGLNLVFSPGDGPVFFDIGGSAEVKSYLRSSGMLGCAR